MIKAKSYVYCIAEDGGTLVKIGVAKKPHDRLRELQTGNGRKLYLVAAIPGSFAEECALRFVWGHLHERGEWHFDEGQQISRYFTAREVMLDRLEATGEIPGAALRMGTVATAAEKAEPSAPITAPTRPNPTRTALQKNALTDFHMKDRLTPGRYADGNGLFLVVDQTGNKRWELRLVEARTDAKGNRVKGKRREIGLGNASLLSLAEARAIAIEARRSAARGADLTAFIRLRHGVVRLASKATA